MCLFRIGSIGTAPGLLERLDVEKTQRGQTLRYGTRRLSLLEQLRLIFTNVSRAQAIWGTVETSRKFLDGTKVTAYGSRRVVTSLEFFQHHFAKSGHGDLLMTRQLISTARQPPLRSPHAKRPPPRRLRSSQITVHVRNRTDLPGKPVNFSPRFPNEAVFPKERPSRSRIQQEYRRKTALGILPSEAMLPSCGQPRSQRNASVPIS